MNTPPSSIILVPVDFSKTAESAAIHAALIASKSGDEICLFHVIDKNTRTELKKNNADESALSEKLKHWANQLHASHQVRVTWLLRAGNIFNTIGEVALEKNASLIVMGTHGVQGIQHLVGAYALRVVASSKVPVIIVQDRLPLNSQPFRLVSPIDSSVETKQKTIQTITIAKLLGAKVYLFKQKGIDDYQDDLINLNANFVSRYLREHQVDFEVVAQQKAGKHFAKEFLAYSVSVSADLIIILTTAEKELKDLIVGPEEQMVINNNAQIPVMCVNPLQNLYRIERIASAVNLSF